MKKILPLLLLIAISNSNIIANQSHQQECRTHSKGQLRQPGRNAPTGKALTRINRQISDLRITNSNVNLLYGLAFVVLALGASCAQASTKRSEVPEGCFPPRQRF